MSKSMLAFLLVLVALVNTSFADQDFDFYDDAYLNRKIFLLGKDETPENEICFRSTFRYHLSSDIFNGDPNGLQSRWDEEHEQSLVKKKSMEKEDNGTALCNSWFSDYIFAYKLPENWQHGAPLNYIDQFHIYARKLFTLNYPESCENVDKFGKLFTFLMKQAKSTVEKKVKLEDGGVQRTVKICFMLEKFEDQGF